MPRNLLVVGHATHARRGLAGFEPGCIYVGLLMGRSILPACSHSRSSRLMAPTLVLSAVVLRRAGTVVLPPSTPHAPHVPPHAPHTPLSSHMLLTLVPRTLCSTSPPKHCTLELVPLCLSTFPPLTDAPPHAPCAPPRTLIPPTQWLYSRFHAAESGRWCAHPDIRRKTTTASITTWTILLYAGLSTREAVMVGT